MNSFDDKRDRVMKAALGCRAELIAYARPLLGNYAAADDVLARGVEGMSGTGATARTKRDESAVRGRLRSEARVYFGTRVTYPNGEFAGMFRGDLHEKQPLAAMDRNGRFEEFYDLRHFTIDPAVRDRKDELAARPDGLILDGVWAFTHTSGPSGLEVTEVELIPPERNVPEAK